MTQKPTDRYHEVSYDKITVIMRKNAHSRSYVLKEDFKAINTSIEKISREIRIHGIIRTMRRPRHT